MAFALAANEFAVATQVFKSTEPETPADSMENSASASGSGLQAGELLSQKTHPEHLDVPNRQIPCLVPLYDAP